MEFLPWKRAISMAKDDPGAVACHPGHHCHHVEGLVPSDPIGNGPLGFARKINAPVTWTGAADLGERNLKIGTVRGYANTGEFDDKAGTGWPRANPAADALTSLRKQELRHIGPAVIDKLVLASLRATEPTPKDAAATPACNPRPLEDKTLFLCFTDGAGGLAPACGARRAVRPAFLSLIVR